jgi:hypothetical protein
MDATIKPISEPQMELRTTFTGINHLQSNRQQLINNKPYYNFADVVN